MPLTPITAPVVTPGPLFDNELNTPLATLTNAINAIIGVVNSLTAGDEVDLSGYATTAALAAHVASVDAHSGFLRCLAGGLPKTAFVQFLTGTTNGSGISTVVYPTAYVTEAYPMVSARSNATFYFSQRDLTGCEITSSSATKDWILMVVGW